MSAAPLEPGTQPHYYSVGNYANSPLHMSDAVVDFSGGGGTGATAVAVVNPTTGAITGYDVTGGGTGYNSAPSVDISSPVAGGTGASATATIGKGVTSIAVTLGGAGYTQPPTVTIAGNGAGATATPTMSGFVGSIMVGLGGSGFTSATVTIQPPSDPGGVDATAHAVIGTVGGVDGVITDIVVDNPGSGYTVQPGVEIVDSAGAAVTAVAKAFVTMDTISSIEVTDTGTGYSSATVVITPTAGGAGAAATATISGAVTDVTVVAAGSGYVTPGGIKKFVDTLPGLGTAGANNLGQYIPIATPDTTTYPGTDYYEIGVVQYRERMSSSLPEAGTLVRGYVQLSTDVTQALQPAVDKHVALTNANLDPTIEPSPIRLPNGAQAFGVDGPHSYGPLINATKDRPVRVLFRNLLPTGVAGDLFLPTDTTVSGAGYGPAVRHAARPGSERPCRPEPAVRKRPEAGRLLHGEPRDHPPARWHHAVDQRRHSAPVDHPGRTRTPPTPRVSA